MSKQAIEEIQNDELAMSMAHALAVANEAAASHGLDLERSLVTVTEESAPPDRLWSIHYGPRDFVNRRGGDLTVVVNDRLGVVERVIRGQ